MKKANFVWSDRLKVGGLYLIGPSFETVEHISACDGSWYRTDARMNTFDIHAFGRRPFVLFGPLPYPNNDEYRKFISKRED